MVGLSTVVLLLKRSVAYPIISALHIVVAFYDVQCSNVLPRLSFQFGYYLIPNNNSVIYFLNILSEFPKTTLKYIFKSRRSLFFSITRMTSSRWKFKFHHLNNANLFMRLINNNTAKSPRISPLIYLADEAVVLVG